MLTDALSRCSHFYIDGKWVEPSKKDFETFEKKIPTTGETVAKVAQASKEDVDLAVAAARKCLNSDGWGYKSTGAQRAAILRKLGKILKDRSNQLAKVDCYDNGKPMREALADMGDAVSQCEHFADLAEKQDKEQQQPNESGAENGYEDSGSGAHEIQNMQEQKWKAVRIAQEQQQKHEC